ncbi:unnamed protein product [Amoebophrya sp. A120]|nr:unnamed protein product [Amoebophrya sp. A120]|eukprot:GSA120T00006281001.1
MRPVLTRTPAAAIMGGRTDADAGSDIPGAGPDGSRAGETTVAGITGAPSASATLASEAASDAAAASGGKDAAGGGATPSAPAAAAAAWSAAEAPGGGDADGFVRPSSGDAHLSDAASGTATAADLDTGRTTSAADPAPLGRGEADAASRRWPLPKPKDPALGCQYFHYSRPTDWRDATTRRDDADHNPNGLVPHLLDLTNVAAPKGKAQQLLAQAEKNANRDTGRLRASDAHSPFSFQNQLEINKDPHTGAPAWEPLPVYQLGQNVAVQLVSLSQDKVQIRKNYLGQRMSEREMDISPEEIAIVIAGNSGLPGGRTAWISKKGEQLLDVKRVHASHGSQEESVVSNWITNEARWFFETLLHNTGTADAYKWVMWNLYAGTIGGKWGLYNQDQESEEWCSTLQGVNYVKTENPVDYSDCWVVRNTRIGPEDEDEKQYQTMDGANEWGMKIGGLFFVAAPNAGSRLTPVGSTARTLNKRASDSFLGGEGDFGFFLQGLEAAVTGVIDAAIREQLLSGRPTQVLIFNKLGGGLYWPKAGPIRINTSDGTEIRRPNVDDPACDAKTYGRIFLNVLNGTVKVAEKKIPKWAFFKLILLTGL